MSQFSLSSKLGPEQLVGPEEEAAEEPLELTLNGLCGQHGVWLWGETFSLAHLEERGEGGLAAGEVPRRWYSIPPPPSSKVSVQ